MSLYIKSQKEIEAIRASGQILNKVLDLVAQAVKPGISTWELNEIAEKEISRLGAKPAFKGYGDPENSYPAALCTSVNDVVVHGIPSKREILQTGDIIGLDLGVEYKGMYSDSAITVPVGEVSIEAMELMQVTKQVLSKH
jgi:methionyl aminopeptidase